MVAQQLYDSWLELLTHAFVGSFPCRWARYPVVYLTMQLYLPHLIFKALDSGKLILDYGLNLDDVLNKDALFSY